MHERSHHATVETMLAVHFLRYGGVTAQMVWNLDTTENPSQPCGTKRVQFQHVFYSLVVQMVGAAGVEPATSASRTLRAPNCATPRSGTEASFYLLVVFLSTADFMKDFLCLTGC